MVDNPSGMSGDSGKAYVERVLDVNKRWLHVTAALTDVLGESGMPIEDSHILLCIIIGMSYASDNELTKLPSSGAGIFVELNTYIALGMEMKILTPALREAVKKAGDKK